MTPTTETRPVEHLRADAARNVHRIVEVAARLLGDDPHAGMAELAAAAGVSRATVYRHFATREALLEAIRRQAGEQSVLALERCRLEEGSAADALRRLVAAWLDIAERYAYSQLAAQGALYASEAARARRSQVLGGPLRALLERGQAAGEFSPALPPEWTARVFGAVVVAGARAVSDGELARADAPDLVVRTLLDGLRA